MKTLCAPLPLLLLLQTGALFLLLLPLEVCAYFEADPAVVEAGELNQIFCRMISVVLGTLCTINLAAKQQFDQ